MYVADKLDAEAWHRVGVVLASAGHDSLNWDADSTNPSAYVEQDGSSHLMYRRCAELCSLGEYIGLVIAPHWNCTGDQAADCQYSRIPSVRKKPLWSGFTTEDPFIYKVCSILSVALSCFTVSCCFCLPVADSVLLLINQDNRGGWHCCCKTLTITAALVVMLLHTRGVI